MAVTKTFAYEFQPLFPIRPFGIIHHHNRQGLGLAGLHQRERLKPFIVCSEPSGKQRDSVRLPDKDKLAGKKVFQVDEFLVFPDKGIGLLLMR